MFLVPAQEAIKEVLDEKKKEEDKEHAARWGLKASPVSMVTYVFILNAIVDKYQHLHVFIRQCVDRPY